MNKFVLAAVSGLALTFVSGVNAQEAEHKAAPEVEHKAAPEADHKAAPEAEHKAAPAEKPCPAAHKHHKKHHAHKHHRGHAKANHPLGVAVTFPPECGCVPEYYQGNPECPYQYYSGYFWYPHKEGTLLPGYTAYYAKGYYWYASRQHPHSVYVEKQPLVAIYPVPMY